MILRGHIDVTPFTLDPGDAGDAASIFVASALHRRLFSPFGESADLGAARDADVSADGRTHRIALRGDLAWSDGGDIVADDFARGLRRASARRSPLGTLLNAVVAREPGSKGGLDVRGVDGILEMRTRLPFRSTRLLLASAAAVPAPPHLAPSDAWHGRPSSGVFRLPETATAGFDLWPDDARPAGERATNALALDVVADPEQSIERFEDDRSSAFTCGTAFPFRQLRRRRSDPRLRSRESEIVGFVCIGDGMPGGADRGFRQAVSIAIDRQHLERCLAGGVQAWSNFGPASMTRAASRRVPPNADPERARRMIGRSVGPIDFLYADHYPNREIVSTIAEDLNEAGIEAVPRPLPLAALVESVESGRFALALALMSPPAVHRSAALAAIAGRADPGLLADAVGAMGSVDMDGDGSELLLDDIEERLASELPVIPVAAFRQIWMQREGLTGYRLLSDGSADFRGFGLAS